jgi:hypothetical protein
MYSRKAKVSYAAIKRIYDNSVAAVRKQRIGPRGDTMLMCIDRPSGGGLPEERSHMRRGAGYPVKLTARSLPPAGMWGASSWWYQWPCNTYIYKLPDLRGVSDIDDNYVTDEEVPQDRFEISYAPSKQTPLPLVVWRPDGSCVISSRVCAYGENGTRQCVYDFTPVHYIWSKYGNIQITLNNQFWIKGPARWVPNIKYHYHFPRRRGDVSDTEHMELLGIPREHNRALLFANSGFIIPKDRRKRPISSMAYVHHDFKLGRDVVQTKLLSEYNLRRNRRHQVRRERAIRSLQYSLQRSPELLLAHPDLREYAQQVATRQGILRTEEVIPAAGMSSSTRKQLDYSKKTRRAFHFIDA